MIAANDHYSGTYLAAIIVIKYMVEVSAGIVVKNGKILCMQRKVSKYSYISEKFEFPGGKVEPGEDPKGALIREFEEELGADISKSKIDYLCSVSHDYPDFSIKMHVFVVFDDNFSFVMKEHISNQWLDSKNLSNLDWAEADREIIDKVRDYLE